MTNFEKTQLRRKITKCLGNDILTPLKKREEFQDLIINYIINNDLIAYGLDNIEFVFKNEYDTLYKGVDHSIFSSPFNSIYIIILK